MSRRTAAWSAAALTVVFVLLFGAVLLRPTFSARADEAAAPTTVVNTQSVDAAGEFSDDAWFEDEEHEDEHEQEDEDDD